MADPLISVVIPTHNRSGYLMEALKSVFAQTLTDYEIIVVDDGSTDDTKRMLAPLVKQGKVRYEFQQQAGVSKARNRGVALAKGRYIAFLDSDDLFLPSKLEKQVAVFQKQPELGFVHCSFSKFDDEGHDLGVRDTSRFEGEIYPEMLLEWSVLMAMPCMLMRREAVLEAGGFDEQMRWAEDLDLWRRIAMRFPVGVVPEALVKVRVHPTNVSNMRPSAIQDFKKYIDKAIAEDSKLTSSFTRAAYSTMYSHFAMNMLGEGNLFDMKQVRSLCGESLKWKFLQIDAYLVWIASLIPPSLRQKLAGAVRRRRYFRA